MQDNSYLNNLYQGIIKPMQRKHYSKPVFIEVFTIGKAGKYFTNVKVWLREPTKDFPQIGLFISFNNGNGSSFSRLENPEEIQTLIDFLTKCKSQIISLYPEMQGKLAAIEAADKAWEEQIKQIELVQRLSGRQQEEPIPLPEEEQYGDNR